MTGPLFVMCVETIAGMNSASGAGGGSELLPGFVVHGVPHSGAPSNEFAQPLNDAGAAPPLRVLSFHHCAPQNVTALPTVALPSPITKLPAEAEGARHIALAPAASRTAVARPAARRRIERRII